MFTFKKKNKTKQNSTVNCFQVQETRNKACYSMSINDLPFGSADASHEGRDQKNIPLETQEAATRIQVTLLHSFGYFYLKLSKSSGSTGFYFKGNLPPIKFQRTELHNPFWLKPKWARLLKKNFTATVIRAERVCPILSDSSRSSPPPHQRGNRDKYLLK